MMNAKKQIRSHCPINFALEFIGDKWSLLILRDLIFLNKTRYQDYLHSEEGISTNILADRLVALEREGFITKQDDPDNGRQYIYQPTGKALDLIPMMFGLIRWSCAYDPKTETTQEFLNELEERPEKLIENIMERFQN